MSASDLTPEQRWPKAVIKAQLPEEVSEVDVTFRLSLLPSLKLLKTKLQLESNVSKVAKSSEAEQKEEDKKELLEKKRKRIQRDLDAYCKWRGDYEGDLLESQTEDDKHAAKRARHARECLKAMIRTGASGSVPGAVLTTKFTTLDKYLAELPARVKMEVADLEQKHGETAMLTLLPFESLGSLKAGHPVTILGNLRPLWEAIAEPS